MSAAIVPFTVIEGRKAQAPNRVPNADAYRLATLEVKLRELLRRRPIAVDAIERLVDRFLSERGPHEGIDDALSLS